jgi:hypothetical protein
VTPRSRPRKSKPLERDELEHALLSGDSRLGSGSRGRVSARKKAQRPTGAFQYEGMDTGPNPYPNPNPNTGPELLALAAAEHAASPWQPHELGEHAASPWQPHELGEHAASPWQPHELGEHAASPWQPHELGEHAASPWQPHELGEHAASPWQPHELGEHAASQPPLLQNADSVEGKTLGALRSADDCAAASALAMLFECATGVLT